MKPKKIKSNLLVAFFLFSIILTTSVAGFAYPYMRNNQRDYSLYSTPIGHTNYLVLMANGIYDPKDPYFTPPDFNFFSHQIMGWNDAQITQYRQKAVSFFSKRFGVDPDSAKYTGRVIMVPFMLDPRWEYRVYNKSNAYVPPQGWVARDGGFQLIAIDPDGVELGGEFSGWHAPKGAIAAFGEFNIQVAPQIYKQPKEIIIHYESRQPVLQNSGFPLDRNGNGTLIAPFDVYHPQWGHGWAFAHITDVLQQDGKLQTNNRNIMTFPAGAAFPNTNSSKTTFDSSRS
ncbi:hypothetical protein [Desmonostoc muscorum]|nr:hypothetical protein [Desmonostoc muscorum]